MQIGFNGRFFKENWRPALQEIEFGRQCGFRAIQFQGYETGLAPEHLGAEFPAVRDALGAASMTAILEIVVRVHPSGRTASDRTPLEVLHANLTAIEALPCPYVHWHLIALPPRDIDTYAPLEQELRPQFEAALELARERGFQFSFEHNEPELPLFNTPASCAAMLSALPELGLLWDLNHTSLEHRPGFAALAPRVKAIHVSDTPYPVLNCHLPLGHGSVDFPGYVQILREANFAGLAILEIGGQPKWTGHGQDTDAALIDSLARLSAVQRSD